MSSRGPSRPGSRSGNRNDRLRVIAGVFGILVVLAMVLGGVLPVILDFTSRGGPGPALETPTPGPSQYEQELRAAVAANPDDPQLLVSLANLLVATGNSAEAIGIYEDAVELDPERLETRLDFGTALARQGAQADAEAQLNRAVAIAPASADARLLLGEVYLYWQPARPDDARREFAAAVAAQPDSVAALRAREYLASLGDATPQATALATPAG